MANRLNDKSPKVWTSAAARRLLALAGNPVSVKEAVTIVSDRLLDGVSCPPTDLDAIMPRLNITGCDSDPEIPVSGALRRNGDGFRIITSAYLSPPRKRWTIAHEIAHAVFETTGPNCPRHGEELERLCDMIATEILLPRTHILPLVQTQITFETITSLANTFKTSLAATAIRCAQVVGISVFEIEANRLQWGYGIIRKGRFVEKDDAFREAVVRAMRGEAGTETVVLRFENDIARWSMEWKRLGETRALFLLSRVKEQLNDFASFHR